MAEKRQGKKTTEWLLRGGYLCHTMLKRGSQPWTKSKLQYQSMSSSCSSKSTRVRSERSRGISKKQGNVMSTAWKTKSMSRRTRKRESERKINQQAASGYTLRKTLSSMSALSQPKTMEKLSSTKNSVDFEGRQKYRSSSKGGDHPSAH